MASNPNRPSYASVASGLPVQRRMDPSVMNTLAAVSYPNLTGSSTPQPPPPRQARREPSRGSFRSMEIDGGNGAWWQSRSGIDDGTGHVGYQPREEHPTFFTPSYLRRSRHVERLRRTHQEHIRQLREAAANQPPPPSKPALSARSSNTNLGKLHSSHRIGVVQDVIERIPPPAEEDKSHPLPSRWNEEDRLAGLEVLGDDGEEVRFGGVAKGEHEAASIRADHPMPREVGLYYYEVTILSRGKEGWIGVGFSGKRVSLNRLPGWETDSWAYHGDDGYSFACTASGKAYGPKFSAYDVIGCGVNFRTGNAFFTKNGVYLGTAFSGIKSDKLYPSVGVRKPGEHLRANFGRKPFVFDIERLMDEERRVVAAEIRSADTTLLRRGMGETQLVQKLVGQYLAHEGYVETARAFAAQAREDRRAIRAEGVSAEDEGDDGEGEAENVHAVNRQKIRRAILDGDIDRALKFMGTFYPRVLEEERNRDVLFRLRCRKFVEMMRRYTELSAAAVASDGDGGVEEEGDSGEDGEDYGEVDGHADNAPPDTQMELDDQLHREATSTTTSSKPPTSQKKRHKPQRSSDPPPRLSLPLDIITDPEDDMDMDGSSAPPSPSHSHTSSLPKKATAMHATRLLHAALSYGQELQRTFGGDPRPAVKKQLSDVFAIMAYTDPARSCVGGVMSERGRVRLAEEVGGCVLVSLGQPSSAALEKLVRNTEMLIDETVRKGGGAGAAFVNPRVDFLGQERLGFGDDEGEGDG